MGADSERLIIHAYPSYDNVVQDTVAPVPSY